MLTESLKLAVIRGNAAEIANLAGENRAIKGVDSGAEDGNNAALAVKAARLLNTVIVITGKQDYISDGDRLFICSNGHPLLTKVTGTGCLLSSVVGAFCAVENDFVHAAASAVAVYGCAAEKAAERLNRMEPGSFQTVLLNELFSLTEEGMKECIQLEEVQKK
jgi:hydroxyethylthiazole kinase